MNTLTATIANFLRTAMHKTNPHLTDCHVLEWDDARCIVTTDGYRIHGCPTQLPPGRYTLDPHYQLQPNDERSPHLLGALISAFANTQPIHIKEITAKHIICSNAAHLRINHFNDAAQFTTTQPITRGKSDYQPVVFTWEDGSFAIFIPDTPQKIHTLPTTN